MATVTRLLTIVEVAASGTPADAVDDGDEGMGPDGAKPGLAPTTAGHFPDELHEMSFSALHLAVLDDGRRLTLLDDRGWGVTGLNRTAGVPMAMSADVVEADARTGVGPDEADDAHSQDEVDLHHWVNLASILARQGVRVDAATLSRLPHDVELSDRVQGRLTWT